MASSGSVDFSVSRDDIIKQALQDLGVLGDGESASVNQTTDCARLLNLVVKNMQGDTVGSRGLKVWSRKRATLFLQKAQFSYNIGPTGDHAVSSYVTTTLTVNAATSATSLTVASITGISNGDAIGIILNSGSFHWTTVNGAPSGSTVVITTGLPSAADSGKRLYTHTTANLARRPIVMLSLNLRDTTDNDVPLDPMSFAEYEVIPDKTSDADPSRYYYEAQLSNGVLYFDREPSDVTKLVKFVYLSPIEDFDQATDTPDYPQEWFDVLVTRLALRAAPMFGRPVTPGLQANATMALSSAQALNPETTDVYFQPGDDW